MAETTTLLHKPAMRVHKHPFDAERLILFSDGIFAVIMTVMVVPLKLNEKDVVDFALLCATFLPYALSLISVFIQTMPYGFHLAISLGAVPVFLLGLIKTAIMWYSLRSPELLTPGSLPMRTVKVALYSSFLSSSVLAVVAVLIGFAERLLTLSRVCLFATTGVATTTRFVFYLYLRCKRDEQYTFLSEPPSRARVEALTDGVFSITATLMLLDFSSQGLPSVSSVQQDYKGSLIAALDDERYIFFSYIVSFIIIGMLWLVQYSMFQLITTITPALTLVNLLTLGFIGVIPFTSGLIVIFSEAKNSDNEVLAVQVAMVVIFLAGVTQLLFWCIATLQNNVVTVEDPYINVHQFIKTLILPTVSFIVYWVSLAPDYAVVYLVYAAALITTPFLFILLNLSIYAWLRKCKTSERTSNDMGNLQNDSVS